MDALARRKSELKTQLARMEAELRKLDERQSRLQGELDGLRQESLAHSNEFIEFKKESESEDRESLLRSGAKYLRGKDRIDSGELFLYWDRLIFRGWGGNATINLARVGTIERGESRLPARSGVPLLSHIFPGVPVIGETVVLRTALENGEDRLAVIAGLPPGKAWNDQIKAAVEAIPQKLEIRQLRARAAAKLGTEQADADARAREISAAIDQVASEIAEIEGAMDEVHDELALPDWENKVLRLKGRNIEKQLDRELKGLSRERWELVSTSSPRKDEMVVTLKRVRPV